MTRRHEFWFEDTAGPLVRPFAMARGRGATVRNDLDVATLVVAAGPHARPPNGEPEYAAIVRLCQLPQSIAEVAAALKLPMLLTKILVGDLIDEGHLHSRPRTYPLDHQRPDIELIREVLKGIRGI